MARLQEHTDKTDEASDDEEQREVDEELDDVQEQQRQLDLARARSHFSARPIKKELRHSQIEGRYIPPPELQKEIDKLEKAKEEAAHKKRNFLARMLLKNPAVHADKFVKKKKEPLTEEEKKARRNTAKRIHKLRGLSFSQYASEHDDDDNEKSAKLPEKKTFEAIPEERSMPAGFKTYSFAESVKRLNGTEEEKPEKQDELPVWAPQGGFTPTPVAPMPVAAPPIAYNAPVFTAPVQPPYPEPMPAQTMFAPAEASAPEITIASALSVAVGFVYRDEDGQEVDRVITIRRLFMRHGDILIDAFCPDLNAPRMIPFSHGIRMYSLKTMATYDNPRDFLLYRITGLAETADSYESSGFTKVLAAVRYELAALAVVAGSGLYRSDEKNKQMLQYVLQRCPTIDFDESEMLDYISMLVPDEQSFFESIEMIVKQPRETVYLFVRTFMKILLSDGIFRENEREFLAELLNLLQYVGIDLNRLGLE